MFINRIFEHAREAPESLAVVISGEEITYLHLAQAIEAVRNFLRASPLPSSGLIVTIATDLFSDWVLMLALRSLGLTTVASDKWQYIEELDLAEISALVCNPDQTSVIAAFGASQPNCPIIKVSRDLAEGRVDGPSPLPVLDSSFGDHITYTSGSTGRSKKLRFSGELLERSIKEDLTGPLDSTISKSDTYYNHGFGPWTKMGYIMPLVCWYHGATVVFEHRSDWIPHFFDHDITKTILVPRMLKELCQSAPPQPLRATPLKVLVGGGFVDADLALIATEKLGCEFFMAYGATEVRVALSRLVKTADDVVWLERAFDPGIDIVDEDDRPVSTGQEGNLRIRLASTDPTEYIDDPEATAKYYRDGYFYPGDVAVERDDGRIRILGRVDDVLNIGGAKLAAEVVEELARSTLDVEYVCMFNYHQEIRSDQLLVVIEGASLPERSRLEALGRMFPEFPHIRYVSVRKFPRGTNGMMKIDRRRLLNMVRNHQVQQGEASTA